MASQVSDTGAGGDKDQDGEEIGTPKPKKLSKAERKEQERLRQVERQKTELRHEFARELALSRKTAEKLQLEWRDIMGDLKIAEFKREITACNEKLMRQYKEKDERIGDMLKQMNSIDETNNMIHSQLSGYFEYISDVYNVVSESSKNFYEATAYEMINNFLNELQEPNHNNRKRWLNGVNIMHTTNALIDKMLSNEYDIFIEQCDYVADTEIGRRYQIKENVVKKMTAAQKQLLDFVNEIIASPLDPKKYARIRKKQNLQSKLSKIEEALQKTLKKKRQQYNDLKFELQQLLMKSEKNINDLLLERSYFKEIRKAIDNNINENREGASKLAIVASESYMVIKHFEKLRQYGEMLLSTAASIRKHQTEVEKIVIWADHPPLGESSSELEDLRKFALTVISPEAHADRTDEDIYKEFNLLRIFYRRVAVTQMQNNMLKEEKRRLLAENKKYTDFIRSLGDEKCKLAIGPNEMGVQSVTLYK